MAGTAMKHTRGWMLVSAVEAADRGRLPEGRGGDMELAELAWIARLAQFGLAETGRLLEKREMN